MFRDHNNVLKIKFRSFLITLWEQHLIILVRKTERVFQKQFLYNKCFAFKKINFKVRRALVGQLLNKLIATFGNCTYFCGFYRDFSKIIKHIVNRNCWDKTCVLISITYSSRVSCRFRWTLVLNLDYCILIIVSQ